MRRGLPGTAGALLAAAVFFGGASTYAPLVWIGGLALLLAGVGAALVLLGLLPAPRLDGFGIAFLGLFGGLVVWNGLSIVWSIVPDRSWEYFNRGLVYLAFAVVGVILAGSMPRLPRTLAIALLAIFGAAIAWALLGKVIPNLGPDAERSARLRDPLGYSNALALVAAMAMPLALWASARRMHPHVLRIASVVLLYLASVALLLTYSRGGTVVALAAVCAYLALSTDRVDGFGALLVSTVPAILLGLWAFEQPGLVTEGQSYDTRLTDGLQFGAALVLGGAAVAALAHLGIRHERRWRPRFELTVSTRRVVGFVAAFLLVAVLAASRGDPVAWARDGFREFTNPTSGAGTGPERLGDFNSNSRWTWWEEAAELWTDNPIRGTGAGSFSVARRPIRTNTTVATEPHNLALQWLSETGLIGFLLAAGVGASAAFAIVLTLRRLEPEERAAALALTIVVLAYLAHSLLDYDWDFVAVTAPLALVLGALVAAGRPRAPREASPFLAAAAALVAVAAVVSLISPWIATREVSNAYAALDRRSVSQAAQAARRARSWNPLSVEPLFAEAAAEEAARNDHAAQDLYIRAVELQPENPRTWYELGRFELDVGLRESGIRHLIRSRELDRWGPAEPLLGRLGL
jgi:hypothetical protein